MLRRGQGLKAMAASRRGSTRLEDELLPAMESFLERIDVIDQQLREAQDRQVAQFELSGCRGCPPHHPPGRRASRDQRSAS